jgi:dihydrofolate reductase
MRLSLIVAVAENGIIGRDGQLPWRLSSDLRRFRRLTMGHALIMGRKTYESIGKPLPGRRSIVISGNPRFMVAGCQVVSSWEAALKRVDSEMEAFVIGGRRVFADALSVADRLCWTQVHAETAGDVKFPSVTWSDWRLLHEEQYAADDRNEFAHSFREYERALVSGQEVS